MGIKKNDFVELDFTGKLKDGGHIFDTTVAAVAKENGLPEKEYKPIIICIGERHLFPGLDDALLGKELGTYTLAFEPEQAFGKKDAKLIQMIPLNKFKEQKIDPVPGLQINVDGTIGTIIRASGGRVMMDFNHPLAGRPVVYEVTLKRIVTDKKEKLEALLRLMGWPQEVAIEGEKATITLPQELPKEITDKISEQFQDLTGLKEIAWAKPATTPQQ